MVEFIDTHAHLFAEEFHQDIQQVLIESKNQNVNTILLPNIDETSIQSMLNLTNASSNPKCIPMIGLHPCHVTANFSNQLETIFKHFQPNTFCAIGEMGLDLYWDQTTLSIQSQAFIWQVHKAIELNLPLVIHTRNATMQTLNLLKPFKGKVTGVFHCFGDTYEIAQQIIDLGFYIGIGGVLTFKNSGLSEQIKNIPLNHMLLETDSPYLAPMPHRGKRNQSNYIPLIAQKLAEIKNCSVEQVALTTTQNAKKLFQLI